MALRTVPSLLRRIESYYDAVPRTAAQVETHGPLTLFVRRGTGWHYYARPQLGGSAEFSVDDVRAVRARQRELGAPEAFEWVAEISPGLRTAAEAAGLAVHEHPLMSLDPQAFAGAPAPSRPGLRLRMVRADDPDLAVLRAVAEVGFSSPGTQVGAHGREALALAAARQSEGGLAPLRARLRSGQTVMAVASDAEGPLAVGSHQPIRKVTEIVGVATLPAARRQGLGSAVTHALVSDALQGGCDLVFLSAGDEDVARIYHRLGFRRIGTALIAEPPPA